MSGLSPEPEAKPESKSAVASPELSLAALGAELSALQLLFLKQQQLIEAQQKQLEQQAKEIAKLKRTKAERSTVEEFKGSYGKVLGTLQEIQYEWKRLEQALEMMDAPAALEPLDTRSHSPSSAPFLHPSSPLLASSPAQTLKVDPKMRSLLQHVAYGDQQEAEALVQKEPGLLLCKGDVMDLSGREFKEITAFQYALWALDWHMWTMLLQYLAKEKAALQFAELEEKGTSHGKYFSLVPLIGTLAVFVKHQAEWSQEERDSYWSHQVGGLQGLLPVHVVNEYCQPNRPLSPCPDFKTGELIRTRAIRLVTGEAGEAGFEDQEWFTGSHPYYGGGGLGKKFAYVKGLYAAGPEAVMWVGRVDYVQKDAEALQSLWQVRQEQLEALKAELAYFVAVTPHLSPALVELVLGYLAGEGAAVSVPRM